MRKLTGTTLLKEGFARMQKGGVIMDVTTPAQARIAERAGAVAVMALHMVPADIRKAGGVARMADPAVIGKIMAAVTIPVMAKCRIGHTAEAQILQHLGVDMVDESEVLTPADEEMHIVKKKFTVPFVCGARDLGEALRRIHEGAAMVRTKGEPGTGNVVEAVRHTRRIANEIAGLARNKKNKAFIETKASEFRVPAALVLKTANLGRLPVVNFAAGGIATPADAALMMQLGVDGVFVGSGIFKSENPERFAKAIVEATRNYDKPGVLVRVSRGLGEPMKGLGVSSLPAGERMQDRGV
ncbi:MAG: pyridoxal 5'-phosphate synthase lyase subunit PdxS [Candidatus Micrarchaeota archaeon]